MPETKLFDLCVESICHIKLFFLNNDPSFNILGQTLEPRLYCLERCQNSLNLCVNNAHTVLSVITIWSSSRFLVSFWIFWKLRLKLKIGVSGQYEYNMSKFFFAGWRSCKNEFLNYWTCWKPVWRCHNNSWSFYARSQNIRS